MCGRGLELQVTGRARDLRKFELLLTQVSDADPDELLSAVLLDAGKDYLMRLGMVDCH